MINLRLMYKDYETIFKTVSKTEGFPDKLLINLIAAAESAESKKLIKIYLNDRLNTSEL